MRNGANLILIESDKVFLNQRNDTKLYNLPGGGINPGETGKEAAVRESLEENNVLVNNDIVNFFGTYILGNTSSVLIYAADVENISFKKKSSESINANFFSVEEILRMYKNHQMYWGQFKIIISYLYFVENNNNFADGSLLNDPFPKPFKGEMWDNSYSPIGKK